MKDIYYKSTRGHKEVKSGAEAILTGIAPDGGLYVPTEIPPLDIDLYELLKLDYRGRALHIMGLFLTDYTEEELRECIEAAYDEKFDTPGIAPLIKESGALFLELFHGPTQAFKDMALTVLPHLLKTAVRKTGQSKEIVILTATSGDTGKAALEGFAGVAGTRIIVFFPEQGVSDIQKRQMVTQMGENTHVISIRGNFDDAQRGVKELFANEQLKEKMAAHNTMFSSANSINIGRLIPQVVYYFHAYLQACAAGDIGLGDKINFAVPTGNFGNILAGYYAKEMGLPIKTLICASNENKVLTDFFASGVYDKERPFKTTMSPSMDILVSSNLERLLYEMSGKDVGNVRALMEQLNLGGRYEVTGELRQELKDFFAGYASEPETAREIRRVFEETGYLMDPHTAVAYAVYSAYRQGSGDSTPTVVVSTASPYKFARDVMRSLGQPAQGDGFRLMEELSRLSGINIPLPLQELEDMPVRHTSVCPQEKMQQQLEKILWG